MSKAKYLIAARKNYQKEGEIEIDADACVSQSEEGAYVQAWVWVPKEWIGERRESTPTTLTVQASGSERQQQCQIAQVLKEVL